MYSFFLTFTIEKDQIKAEVKVNINLGLKTLLEQIFSQAKMLFSNLLIL